MTMLQLSEQQWAELQAADEHNFVAVVRDDIVRDDPTLADDPTLLERLNAAYARTKELGFTHDGPIVEFLELEARAPGFYRIPPIAAWLDKPGVPGEQRFEMLLAVMRKKQQEMQEKR
ncbi:hypothetical protein WM24_23995 [Burkholderia ubonensis]|uniref:hypothetical protein n=1 Tax=Burkholderia ubonensis TaxID=101571 RepID=UPI00075C19B8|nr:hypothetical protein [Burkholderia ubonensis]KWN80622.1 hypothetical protein WM24_23995 [Burkholderia ubonensis]